MRALLLLFVLILASGAAFFGINRVALQLRPVYPAGQGFYLRYEKYETLEKALAELERRKVIRDAEVLQWVARIKPGSRLVAPGSYYVYAGMPPLEALTALQTPTTAWLKMREGYWIRRNAERVGQTQLIDEEDYIRLANHAELFQGVVEAPIPRTGSLEGYLYPDQYPLGPQTGARQLIEAQLRAFEEKVWIPLGRPSASDLHRWVTVGSMVELEAGKDIERPIIAGVIENRARIGMHLHIDATVLYALQEWRSLRVVEYRSVKSPYNTYLHRGLPPGPIGSPSAASVLAAKNPKNHDYLFYVTTPFSDRRHIFARTYAEHLRNVWYLRNITDKKLMEAGKFPGLDALIAEAERVHALPKVAKTAAPVVPKRKPASAAKGLPKKSSKPAPAAKPLETYPAKVGPEDGPRKADD